ncbi:hypothetical protein TcCL_ESM03445 [Trypanosoma cruzi]|nr:hypothetical protein TcCL_ESM03445 [Trypanosoma cruzi]
MKALFVWRMNLCFEAYFRSCHSANFGKLYHDGFRRPNSSKGVALFKDGGAKIIIRVSRDKKLRLWKHFACGDSSESREVDFFLWTEIHLHLEQSILSSTPFTSRST